MLTVELFTTRSGEARFAVELEEPSAGATLPRGWEDVLSRRELEAVRLAGGSPARK